MKPGRRVRGSSVLASCLLAACGTVPFQAPLIPHEIASVRVARFLDTRTSPAKVGSGVMITRNTLLTCRHVLEQPWVHVEDGGHALKLLDRGNNMSAFQWDWSLYRVGESLASAEAVAPCDFDYPLEEGQAVYFAGFGGYQGRTTMADIESGPARRSGVINRRPLSLDGTERVLYVRVAEGINYTGMSGGPVMVLVDGRPLVVGIMRGAFTRWPWNTDRNQYCLIVVRPPVGANVNAPHPHWSKGSPRLWWNTGEVLACCAESGACRGRRHVLSADRGQALWTRVPATLRGRTTFAAPKRTA